MSDEKPVDALRERIDVGDFDAWIDGEYLMVRRHDSPPSAGGRYLRIREESRAGFLAIMATAKIGAAATPRLSRERCGALLASIIARMPCEVSTRTRTLPGEAMSGEWGKCTIDAIWEFLHTLDLPTPDRDLRPAAANRMANAANAYIGYMNRDLTCRPIDHECNWCGHCVKEVTREFCESVAAYRAATTKFTAGTAEEEAEAEARRIEEAHRGISGCEECGPCKHGDTHWRINPFDKHAPVEVCNDCGKSRCHDGMGGDSGWMMVFVSEFPLAEKEGGAADDSEPEEGGKQGTGMI